MLNEMNVKLKKALLNVNTKSIFDAIKNDTNRSKMINQCSEIDQKKELVKIRDILKVRSELSIADILI